MTKKEMILEAIESLGYKPHVDDDGDVCVRYQMKNIFFLTVWRKSSMFQRFCPSSLKYKRARRL